MTAERDAHEAELEALVDAYEQARADRRSIDLGDFLPPADHPLYRDALLELVRIDLEYGWECGLPTSLANYRQRFPLLFSDAQLIAEIVFEEYRLRLQAGQNPTVEEYQSLYGVNVTQRPLRQAVLVSPGLPDGTDSSARVHKQFRLAHNRGNEPSLDSLGGSPHNAAGDLLRPRPSSNVEATPAQAVELPEPGSDFLGFRLLAELGRGTFGRVFLARQGGLANRHVVLKVSTHLFDESQTLAQLQHTNIVPIYSAHRAGTMQALCMPWLGGVTLAAVCAELQGGKPLPTSGRYLVELLRESPGDVHAPQTRALATLGGLSWVQAVLWIGARLAEGLAHAHEHGILHSDLKPANILLTSDGQPVLLDFNLAQNTRLRSTPSGVRVGGTLPYMAPEHLTAFATPTLETSRRLDPRSDLYSLGVLLYELLASRLPYAPGRGPTFEVIPAALQQRLQPPPRLRLLNPAVSPAVEIILRRCLEVQPARRYPSAQALAEDLDRHLADLPLRHSREPFFKERARKWLRRHPRATSATTVGAIAAGFLLALAGLLFSLHARQERNEAAESFRQFGREKLAADFCLNTREPDHAHLQEGIRLAEVALDRYRVLQDENRSQLPAVRHLPVAQRERLEEDITDLLWSLSRARFLQAGRACEADRGELLRRALDLNRLAGKCAPGVQPARALLVQQADILEGLGQTDEAQTLRREAEELPAQSARDHFLLALELRDRGQNSQATTRLREAIRQLSLAVGKDSRDLWSWYLLGNCHDLLLQNREALTCYTVCTALVPECYEAHFNRGLAHVRERRWQQACGDFGRAIDLRSEEPEAWFQRALAEKESGEHAKAERDLTEALAHGSTQSRLYFLRAGVRDHLGDKAGAKRDRAEGMRREPTDEHSWLERGNARLRQQDTQGALADFARALKVNPRYLPGWQNRAHVLATLGRTQQALEAMEQAVALYPDFVPARLGRGVLLARLGKRSEAHRDAQAALDRDSSPPTLYQAANIYALTARQEPGDRLAALPLLRRALAGGFGLDVIDGDSDMDPIRHHADFRRIVKAARELRGAR